MSMWTARLEQGSVDPRGPELIVAPLPFIQEIRGWTDELVVSGDVYSSDRLSDILNRREVVTLYRPRVRRLGVFGLPVACGERLDVDPFDFDLVVGGPQDPAAADRRAARRVHKCRYPVIVAGDTFEVRGTMHLYPGQAPESALLRTNVLFVPLTDAAARHGGTPVTDGLADVVLVNRYAIRDIRQGVFEAI
jgi:hypothetical protein